MRDRFTATSLVASLLMFTSFCVAQDDNKQEGKIEKASIKNGQAIFERDWIANYRKGAFDDADGLGPLFNATSCVACHNQGGVGGGGDNSSNAQLLSILPARKENGSFDLSAKSLERMFEEGEKIHQDLGSTNGTVLHRHSSIDNYAEWREKLIWGETNPKLADRRNKILDGEPIHRRTKKVARTKLNGKRIPATEFTIQISHRNTPSLFGSGLIEKIPDEALVKIARAQQGTNDGIKGRVSRPDTGIGKFGWRGQKSSLEDFTIQACAVELGLKTPTQTQNELPVSFETPASYWPKDGVDMRKQEVAALVAYVRQLPPPKANLPTDPKRLKDVEKGEQVFVRLNCATCHVKKVGELDGVYSDFLMHNMGPDLADVAGVVSKSTVTVTQGIGGYFGPSTPLQTEQRIEILVGEDSFWQTPPLWGIAQSGPYMHDGRAKNIHEAILFHGGEAEEAKQGYKKLSKKYRRYLLAYIDTLGAVEK